MYLKFEHIFYIFLFFRYIPRITRTPSLKRNAHQIQSIETDNKILKSKINILKIYLQKEKTQREKVQYLQRLFISKS